MSVNHFYNDDFDFEKLIKEKADQFKMYPSSQSWKGIHSALHTPLSWYVTGLFLLTAAIALYFTDPISSSSKTMAQQKPSKLLPTKSYAASEDAGSALHFGASVIPSLSSSRRSFFEMEDEDVVIDDPKAATIIPLFPAPIENHPEIHAFYAEQEIAMGQKSVLNTPLGSEKSVAKVIPISSMSDDREVEKEGLELSSEKLEQTAAMVSSATNPDPLMNIEDNNSMLTRAITSIVKPRLQRSRWQLSVSPTMNYRMLRSQKDVITASSNQVIPIALQVKGDVNQYVKHMPAVGMEVSSMYLFNVNRKWTVKVGGQFNFSRYYIQAFNTSVPEIARINLGTPIGNAGIMSYSKIRNFSGNSFKGIQNQYYQLSTPIGLEYVLLGKRKLQLNLSGTIQPTFLLNRNSYLITTDYKNYTRQPSLVRQWNLNTSGEAFISYKASHYKFQLGPQFRYQLFSTFEKKYPIGEYLMEYGVKFAVTR